MQSAVFQTAPKGNAVLRPEEISILIIDDEDAIRESFSNYLEDEGYQVLTASDGMEGLKLLKEKTPQVVLTDLSMPHMDGLKLIQQGMKISPHIPYIVISGAGEISDIVEAIQSGAWDYIEKPLKNLGFLKQQIEKNLHKYTLERENERYRNHLEELVEQRTRELELRNQELIISRRQIMGILSQAAEYRDFETGQHFNRVSKIAGIIARGLEWPEAEIEAIELSAPIHDVGKIGIADSILMKKSDLTHQEWEEMRNHCQYGKEILTSGKERFEKKDQIGDINYLETGKSILDHAAEICLYHHEHWDGSGYPSGIKEKEIPVFARITAIADVYDALLSRRPYKETWPEEKVLEWIKSKSGTQFDPELVNIFFEHLDEIRQIRRIYSDDK